MNSITFLFQISILLIVMIYSTQDAITIDSLFGECQVSVCGNVFCATSPNGKCIESSCVCENGYISTLNETKAVRCCYKQKNALTAFFLEFFVSFGAGHFYYGGTTYGVVKCTIYVIFLGIILFVVLKTFIDKRKKEREETSNLFRIFRIISLILISFTYICWQMIDSILILLGGYTDKNGKPLY